MRKRILGTLAAASAAILMLSGFDSAMTVEQLTENSKTALAQASSMSVTMNGQASAAIHMTQSGENGATMDIPVDGSLDLNMNLSMEPLQMGMSVSYSVQAMGQGGSGSVQAYLMEKEDGTGVAYTGQTDETGVTQWEADEADAETFAKVKETLKSVMAGDMSALNELGAGSGSGVDPAAVLEMAENYRQQMNGMMQISPQSVNVNGKDCYEVTADIGGETLLEMSSDLIAASGQADTSSLEMIKPVMSGIVMHVESRYDTQTCLPVDALIDLGGSDFSAIAEMLAGSMGASAGEMSAGIDVSALKLTCSFNFDPVTVTVPQEALDAASASTTDVTNPDDLVGGLLSGGSDLTTDNGGSSDTGLDLNADDDTPVQNTDGSYQLQYELYDGTRKKANVAVPEGMTLGYANKSYLAFNTADYKEKVSYSLYTTVSAEETVAGDLDMSYFETDEEYSNISTTGVLQTTLEDGTVVYYGSKKYNFSDYLMGSTTAALQAGDTVVTFEIEKDDENYNSVDVTEEDVRKYAALISPAA